MMTVEIENNMWWEQFSTSKDSKWWQSFCDLLLTYVYLCYYQIKFTNNAIKPHLDRGKSPIHAHDWTVQSPTVRSEF